MKEDRCVAIPCVAIATLILLTVVSPDISSASSLEVTPLATLGGTYGLKVNVSTVGCSPDDLLVDSPPTISGDFEACQTITARDVQVIFPGATFTAGESVTLDDQFVVTVGAPFTVRLSDLLGTPFAYVEDDSPDSEDGYTAKFSLNPFFLTLAAADRLELLNGYSSDDQIQFKLVLKRNMTLGENRLVLAARQNDGSLVETPPGEERLLSPVFNEIRMEWFAGAGDGYLAVSVNDEAETGLSSLTNSNGRIDYIRFGAVGGTLEASTEGFFYLDEFTSRRLFDLTEAPCIIPDDGTGTGEFPPEGCAYMSPSGEYSISNGLPAGTEIVLEPIHRDLMCVLPGCATPGGPLGGETETITQQLVVKAVGTGALAGFERLLTLGGAAVTYSAPRTPGDSVQTFDTEMFQLASSLGPGDPDFDELAILAGVGSSFPGVTLPPSPGQTTMTELPSGDFQVDSFFDITYWIGFSGAAGSVLEGMIGGETGTLRIDAFADPLEIFTDGFESGDVSAWSSSMP